LRESQFSQLNRYINKKIPATFSNRGNYCRGRDIKIARIFLHFAPLCFR